MYHSISKRALLSSVALNLALVPYAPQTFADDGASDELETIAVTGTRQAYRGNFEPLETPQAEQVLDLQSLEDLNAVDLVSALDLSASVARQNNFGGLWNSFAIRGFAGDENLPSNFLVNGFNAGRGFAGPRDISGIEAVEILKGPKAALFGRGEPGGAINIVTKRPTFEDKGRVRFTAGRFDQYRGDVDIDMALSDTFAVRLVGFYEDAESFRDTVKTERFGLYPSLAFRPNENTQIVYELEYTDQEIPFDRGVPAVNNTLGTIPIETFFGEPGNGTNKTKVAGHQIEMQHDFNENWSALIGFNYRDTSLEGYDTAATLSGSRQFLFRDGENLSRERRFRKYDSEYFVVRGELSGEFDTGGLQHRVLVGIDYDEFDNKQLFKRARGGGIKEGEVATDPAVAERLQVINVFNPVYGQFDLPEPTAVLRDRLDTQSAFGFFVQDQISISDKFDVRLGLRFDDYKQSIGGTESSDQRVSPQFGLVYQLNDQVSLYASYGEGFRQLPGNEPNGDPLRPNITKSYEAGVKFALQENAIQGTATVFQIEQDNILAVTPAFEPTAVGQAKSRGFEFDLNGAVTDSIDVLMSYAYTDAEIENEFFDANFGVTIPAGTSLVNVPDHQFTLQVTKTFEQQGLPLRVGGALFAVSSRSGQFGDYFGQGAFELPGYATLRAFAEYEVSDALSLRFDVDNITNKEIYLNSFASLWVQPGAPRTWRLFVEYSF
ncbi:MAG: TonB-dependent siderophore receptor [Kordiimonas sp.]